MSVSIANIINSFLKVKSEGTNKIVYKAVDIVVPANSYVTILSNVNTVTKDYSQYEIGFVCSKEFKNRTHVAYYVGKTPTSPLLVDIGGNIIDSATRQRGHSVVEMIGENMQIRFYNESIEEQNILAFYVKGIQ